MFSANAGVIDCSQAPGSATQRDRAPVADAHAQPIGIKPELVNKFTAIMFGVIAGLDNVGNDLAIAALIFSGPLISGYGLGVGSVLLSGVILAIVVALRSQQPNAVAVVQETSIAILAAAISAAVARMSAPPQVLVATALAILGSATIIAGLLLYFIGRLRLGGLARFLPYPVIAGFLAGSGWLLLVGGLSMVTRGHDGITILAHLADPLVLAKVVPAVVFAIIAAVVLRQVASPMVAPALLIAAAGGFYVVLALAGIDFEHARTWGWVMAVPTGGGIALPTPGLLWLVNWHQVLITVPAALSAAALCMIGVLLNTSGLELANGRELDCNAELRTAGFANLFAGSIGGLSGFVGLGNTLLAKKMGVRGRSAGLSTAAVLALALVFAPRLIAGVPVFLTAGLVMYMGLDLLYEWLVLSRHRLPRTEWLVVLVILVIVALAGFLEGLAAGLIMSVVMFVYSYSRLPVVRLSASGAELRSSVHRSSPARDLLSRHGSAIEGVHLQGYLFFGSAEQIVDHVRRRMAVTDRPGLRFLILDFCHVAGCDSAAAACFLKVRDIAQLAGVSILFSQVSPDTETLLRRGGLEFSPNGPLSLIADMDHALEYCEAILLAEQDDRQQDEDVLHYLQAVLGPHPRLKELIRTMEALYLDQGTWLICAGDYANDVYILACGRVKVQMTLPNGRLLRLRTMTTGGIIGEIALYLRQQRTADVLVEEPSVIYRLGAKDLLDMEISDSEMAVLVHRLLATNLAEKLTLANRQIQLAHG